MTIRYRGPGCYDVFGPVPSVVLDESALKIRPATGQKQRRDEKNAYGSVFL